MGSNEDRTFLSDAFYTKTEGYLSRHQMTHDSNVENTRWGTEIPDGHIFRYSDLCRRKRHASMMMGERDGLPARRSGWRQDIGYVGCLCMFFEEVVRNRGRFGTCRGLNVMAHLGNRTKQSTLR